METRNFKLHPEIIYSIICNQAGSVHKALLELVMNAVDAGSTKVEITFDTTGFTISDDGRGFQSRQEIDDWFETFGTPHQAGDAAFGRFRMGRGQIMAFARTRWQTGPFEMHVDIKRNGLDYGLSEGNPERPGCLITGDFYEMMLPSERDSALRELSAQVAYMNVPIYLNGEVVNKLPGTQKWQKETPEAYYNLKTTGSLRVYNLGAFVREFPNYSFGVGGIVVSKKALELNFARNDIVVAKCETWKKITKHLRQSDSGTGSGSKKKSTVRLDEKARQELARGFLAGESDLEEVLSKGLITDTLGKNVRLSTFLHLQGRPLTVAPSVDNQIAQTLHNRRIAFVLSPQTLTRFGVKSLKELIDGLKEKVKGTAYAHVLARADVRDFADLSRQINTAYDVLQDHELTEEERAVLRAISRGATYLRAMVGGPAAVRQERQIKVGMSDTAASWTDGTSEIVLNRNLLRQARYVGGPAFMTIATRLLHEYLHTDDSAQPHQHDSFFHERYHDLLLHAAPSLHTAVQQMIADYLSWLRKNGKRVNRYEESASDQDAELTRRLSALALPQ